MTREQALKALELHADASFQEIKQAYRDLALVWHPDRFANSTRLQAKASERLKEINTAYAVLRSYDAGPSRAHEPKTKHTGPKHSASETKQSGTQRQRSRTKNRSATSPAEHSESQASKKHEQSARRPLTRARFAGLLFVAVIAGLLLSFSGGPRPEDQASAPLQPYLPITQPDEGGSPAADTVASFPVDFGTDSANPVLAVREPEAAASESSSPPRPQRSRITCC